MLTAFPQGHDLYTYTRNARELWFTHAIKVMTLSNSCSPGVAQLERHTLPTSPLIHTHDVSVGYFGCRVYRCTYNDIIEFQYVNIIYCASNFSNC